MARVFRVVMPVEVDPEDAAAAVILSGTAYTSPRAAALDAVQDLGDLFWVVECDNGVPIRIFDPEDMTADTFPDITVAQSWPEEMMLALCALIKVVCGDLLLHADQIDASMN